MKPDKNFKLSKTAKRMMALMPLNHGPNQFKKMMIDAELTAEHASRMAAKSKGKKNDS